MPRLIGIKLRKFGVIRPERPVLSAQPEGLGTNANLAAALKGPFPVYADEDERAFQARISFRILTQPFGLGSPNEPFRLRRWLDDFRLLGRREAREIADAQARQQRWKVSHAFLQKRRRRIGGNCSRNAMTNTPAS